MYSNNNIDIKEFFKLIWQYKILIFISIVMAISVASTISFFKPSIYSTYSIIEVKTNDKNMKHSDDLLQNAFYSTNKDVSREIEILKTFNIHKRVIDKLNLYINFYIKDKYKKVGIDLSSIPIRIDNLKVLDEAIVGKYIKLTPKKGGYGLTIEHSIKSRILNNLFHKKIISLDNNSTFKFKKLIHTKYFQLSIDKIGKINESIYFVISGNEYSIFKNIIKNRISINPISKNSSLIKIVYEDTIPQRTIRYVNSLVNTFLEDALRDKSNDNNRVLRFINEQLKKTKKRLDISEKRLEDYKLKSGIVQSSSQLNFLVEQISKLDTKILENRLKIKLINNILKNIKYRSDYNSIDIFIDSSDSRVTLEFVKELKSLELKREKLKSEYRDEFPKLILLNKEIDSIKKKININIKNLKSSIEYKISNLEKIKRDYENILNKIPKNETKLANLTRDYKVNSNLYAYLEKKKEEREMIRVAIVSDYKILEKAYIATEIGKSKRKLILVIALIVGFSTGVFLAILHRRVRNKIVDINDIKLYSNLELYSAIPFFKKSKRLELETLTIDRVTAPKEFRKLRMDLIYFTKNNSSTTVLISSMDKREGKTFIVKNLSSIFQLKGYRVLVIDFNLKNPTLHKYFDINNSYGLSDYLINQVGVNEIIFNTILPDLDFIPAGSIKNNYSELILSERLDILFKNLKRGYDYIFIDTSSINSVNETLNLMSYADINFMIVKENYSKRKSLKQIEKISNRYGLNNIKLILNCSNSIEEDI